MLAFVAAAAAPRPPESGLDKCSNIRPTLGLSASAPGRGREGRLLAMTTPEPHNLPVCNLISGSPARKKAVVSYFKHLYDSP